MSKLCEVPLKDGGQCPNLRAADASMCGEHLMAWIKRLTEALRLEHAMLYKFILKHNHLEREDGFWPAFYTAGPLLLNSESRLRDFDKGVYW